MDFSKSLLDFLPKKSFFAKNPSKTFSKVPMEFGTFSERAMDFSEGEFGSFGGVALIPFRASDGNRRL